MTKQKFIEQKRQLQFFFYLSNLSSNRQNINAKKKEKKTTLINKLGTLRTSHERRFRGDMLSGFKTGDIDSMLALSQEKKKEKIFNLVFVSYLSLCVCI